MRKAIKFCLALAMVGTLAIPAHAADVKSKFTGRTVATLNNSTSKAGTDGAKSISKMDMSASARFGAQFDVEGENWNTSAKAEIGLTESARSTRDMKVSLANDALKLTFGRQYFPGVAHGEDYAWTSYSDGAGEHIWASRVSGVQVSILGPKVDIFYAVNEEDDPSDATTDGPFRRTYLGAKWNGEFGDISIDASYTSFSDAIDKNAGGIQKSEMDGRTASEIAFGATYKMGKMGFSLNYSGWSEKAGSEGAEAMAGTSTDLIFDMEMEGLLEGLSASYTMSSKDDTSSGSKKKLDKSAYGVSVGIPTGAATTWVGYSAKSEKGTWEGAKAATESQIDATIRYSF